MSGLRLIGLLADRLYAVCVAALVVVCLVAIAAGAMSGDSAVVTSARPGGVAKATAIAAVPTPAPTPQLWERLLDARRMVDLSALADALSAYHGRYGAYPSTGGATTAVCQASSDAGCKLSGVRPGLSYGDGTYVYQYRSDGATYTLYARVQTAVAPDGCGGEHPDSLAGLPVICRTPAGGP